MVAFLLILHILLIVFAFAFTAGFGILLDRVAASGDAKTIHSVFAAATPLSVAGGIGWLLAALAGGALAGALGLNMMAPWLIGSYVAFAVLILTGFLIHLPWQRKVIAASATPGPELTALLKAPSHNIGKVVSALAIIALIALMIARPG
jgi:hypothetical protein